MKNGVGDRSSEKGIIIFILIVPIMWILHTFSKNFMVDPTFQNFLSINNGILSNESLWILMIRIHISLANISLLTGPLGIIKKVRVKSISFTVGMVVYMS